MDGVVEVITGRERRRRWSTADKLCIVTETREPGNRVCDVSARHGVCETLVFAWRRRAGLGGPVHLNVLGSSLVAAFFDRASLPRT